MQITCSNEIQVNLKYRQASSASSFSFSSYSLSLFSHPFSPPSPPFSYFLSSGFLSLFHSPCFLKILSTTFFHVIPSFAPPFRIICPLSSLFLLFKSPFNFINHSFLFLCINFPFSLSVFCFLFPSFSLVQPSSPLKTTGRHIKTSFPS